MIKIIKSHLYKFPLTQLIRNYMQGFWDEYRLQENAQALLITPKQNQMPGEKISLVVVSETEVDTNHWLPDLFAVDSNLIEIIWVQKRYDATL